MGCSALGVAVAVSPIYPPHIPTYPHVSPIYPHVSPTDINELNLPKTCEIDFSDQDDLLHFRLLICPDEVGPLPHPTTPNLRSPSSCSPFPPPSPFPMDLFFPSPLSHPLRPPYLPIFGDVCLSPVGFLQGREIRLQF